MKSITNWGFRKSIKQATDSYIEMINLKSLLRKNQASWNQIDTFNIPNQRQWVQVLTHDVKQMARFPRYLEDFCNSNPDRANIYGVNLNIGCPEPNIIAAGDGAALIKRTKRLIDLINSFLGKAGSHRFHISLKFRLGLNEKEMTYGKIVSFLESLRSLNDVRINPTIIHFKHAKQSSDSRCHWEYLEPILNQGLPIILNGNIKKPDDLIKITDGISEDHYKCIQGIMIGRAAVENPQCFIPFLKS